MGKGRGWGMSKGDTSKVTRAPIARESQRANKALIERMDRLREKIGPISVPVSKLIREGSLTPLSSLLL